MRVALLIVLFAFLVAGCGGEETVSPTGPVVGTLPKAEAGDAAAGKAVFADNGCGSCHTFKAADANGSVGPNLDDALKGKDADFIHESIVDPNAEIASGFSANVMPPNYGTQLDSKQLADLVALLQTGG